MKNESRLIDDMRQRQSELQLIVNRKQEDLAEAMTELAAVTRAVRAYDDVITPPKKRAKAPLMITGPVAVPAPEAAPVKPRRNRAMSGRAAGGHARAAAMTHEQRQEAGRKGAAARWARQREREAATP